MIQQIKEIFQDSETVKRIQTKLPYLFQLAEIESQRAGKIGMEVGSLRERILVSLLIYKFGENIVKTHLPITEPESDVLLYNKPISIKTKTGTGFAGVKLIWTVDSYKAREFLNNYKPSCDMLFAQIIWDNKGGLFYIMWPQKPISPISNWRLAQQIVIADLLSLRISTALCWRCRL